MRDWIEMRIPARPQLFRSESPVNDLQGAIIIVITVSIVIMLHALDLGQQRWQTGSEFGALVVSELE